MIKWRPHKGKKPVSTLSRYFEEEEEEEGGGCSLVGKRKRASTSGVEDGVSEGVHAREDAETGLHGSTHAPLHTLRTRISDLREWKIRIKFRISRKNQIN